MMPSRTHMPSPTPSLTLTLTPTPTPKNIPARAKHSMATAVATSSTSSPTTSTFQRGWNSTDKCSRILMAATRACWYSVRRRPSMPFTRWYRIAKALFPRGHPSGVGIFSNRGRRRLAARRSPGAREHPSLSVQPGTSAVRIDCAARSASSAKFSEPPP